MSPAELVALEVLLAVHTAVEYGHGFIGGSRLYLHVVGFLVSAPRTCRFGAISIAPGLLAYWKYRKADHKKTKM